MMHYSFKTNDDEELRLVMLSCIGYCEEVRAFPMQTSEVWKFVHWTSHSIVNWSLKALILTKSHSVLYYSKFMHSNHNNLAVVIPQGGSFWPLFPDQIGMLVFVEEGKWEDQEKTLRVTLRTNNNPNPHVMPGLGIKPGPQQWEASALTTAPSPLLPIHS